MWLGTAALLAAGLVAVRLIDAARKQAPAQATRAAVDAQGRIGPCTLRQLVDGDTIDVLCGERRERVRLLRIDTPEREQPGYAAARAALRALLGSGDLWLELEEPGVEARGSHGRLLAYVHAGERNVNLEMVRAGWSTFFDAFGPGRHEAAFVAAEREARSERRGLWGMRALD